MHRLLSLIFVVLYLQSIQAQNWTLVKATSQIVDDKNYIITFTNENGNFHTLNAEYWADAKVYHFRSNPYNDNSYANVDDLVGHTTQFAVKRVAGKRYLYSPKDEKYVSVSDAPSQSTLFQLKNTPDDACLLTFEQSSDGLKIKIGDRYFQHQEASADYRLKTSITKKLMVDLYRQSNGEVEENEVFELSTEKDLDIDDKYGDVRFSRQFKNDYYNTLILPFAVEGYRSVFGGKVEAFEVKSVNGNKLTFQQVQTGNLEAGKPYLLTGTFTEGPYIIKNVYIKDDSRNGLVDLTRGKITFHGVYKKQSVTGKQSFILWQKSFYSCEKISNMTVEPYKWFLTTTGNVENIQAAYE